MNTSVLVIPTLPFDLYRGRFKREPVSSFPSTQDPSKPPSKYFRDKISVYTCTYECTGSRPFLLKQYLDCRPQYIGNSSGKLTRMGWYLILVDRCEPDELLLKRPVWNVPESKGQCIVGKSIPMEIRCQDINLIAQVLGPWPRTMK